ncbi:hypothetical protein TRIUR3_33152 [Triticum urartu]|uniref:Uncharacterized protein n=1 Tax=Triticum urartu TaxID=4572 RepID=M7Z6E8_TRIUA|nr:hypothetical protein TRIUR3_33152 [Triticum urartu]
MRKHSARAKHDNPFDTPQVDQKAGQKCHSNRYATKVLTEIFQTKSYTRDEGNGLLEARLSAPCYATYDNGDLAFFDTVMRGNLSFGALRGCEGLAQEELFMWLPVKGILVSDPGSGVILFDIGYAHKRLSRSLFEEPPDCKPSASTSMGAVEAARWRDSPGEISVSGMSQICSLSKVASR